MDSISLIYKEREEHLSKHGFDAVKDDAYINSELQTAAQAAISGEAWEFPGDWDDNMIKKICDKTKKERLIIAGALYLAERDRINRVVVNICKQIDRISDLKPVIGNFDPEKITDTIKEVFGEMKIVSKSN